MIFHLFDFDFYHRFLIALRLLAPDFTIRGRYDYDYGFFSTGAQAAVDEFMLEAGGSFERRLPPAGCGHFAMMTRLG